MSIDSTELIYLVLGPGVLVLIAVLLRLDFRLKARCDDLQSRLAHAEGELAQLRNSLADDERDSALRNRIEKLQQQHEQLMLRDAEAGPYFRAVRCAENGDDVEALIEQTGVTRAEAELIVSLHGSAATNGADDEAAADRD